MNVIHNLVTFLALVGFIYQALTVACKYYPTESAHIHFTKAVTSVRQALRNRPLHHVLGIVIQFVIILLFIKLSWLFAATLCVGYLLLQEVIVWEAKGQTFNVR